ncbi:MAG: IPTL-CTERM sorting domain-containing protein, partial [Methylococcales bacterium]
TIEITKSLSAGTTPPGSNWQYSLTTSTAGCTVPGGASPFMILAAGGTAIISNLPVNGTSAACEYTATLTAQAGYSVTSTTGGTQNGDSVENITVTEGGTTAVGFTCSEDTSPTGTIEITKSLLADGSAPITDWQYSLITSIAGCTIPGGATPFTIPGGGGAKTISNLPVNGTSAVCEYTATVIAKPGFTVVSTSGAGTQNGNSVVGITVNDGDTTFVDFLCRATDSEDAGVSGVVFVDENKNGVQDPGEGGQSGWTIKIFDSAGSVVETLTTQADGTFTQPSLGTGDFTVQFISPGGLIMQEQQVSLTNGDQQFVPQPIDPAGVIYDEVTGAGIPGVQVFLTSGGTPVPAACVGAGEQGQVTDVDGAYMFFVNPGADSACPAEDTVYELVVVPPTGFQTSGNSPQASVLDADNCTIDAVAGITCEVSNQTAAPITGIPVYFIQIELGAGDPGVFNNHIPLNPFGGVVPPVIPVVPGEAAQKIPTLSEWARIILVTLMGLTVLVQHRRRRKGRVDF